MFSKLRIDPGDCRKPAANTIRDKLTEEQYYVTQEAGNEYAFQNECWNHFAKGIYVDIVTGEPLFSSTDKYESSCGWPAFTKPIEEPSIVELEDLSHEMQRIELRSRAGNSHLMYLRTIPNLPMECDTASTALLFDLCPTTRWRLRAMGILWICLNRDHPPNKS